jgi:hypothetical protein
MSLTHGGKKAKRFKWEYRDHQIIIKNENGRMHSYSVGEIYDIITWLAGKFGDGWFPLANNVQKLGDGTEIDGLGLAILHQRPKDITHAQGSSYLGVVLEEVKIFEWNGKAKGIEWRTIHLPDSIGWLSRTLANK